MGTWTWPGHAIILVNPSHNRIGHSIYVLYHFVVRFLSTNLSVLIIKVFNLFQNYWFQKNNNLTSKIVDMGNGNHTSHVAQTHISICEAFCVNKTLYHVKMTS